jgi:hypothetical protein
MPRKAKAKIEADATEAKTEAAPEAAPKVARGSKTAAVKAALKVNPNKLPKEIAEILQAEGWDIKAQLVSVVKSAMKAKKKAKKAAEPAAEEVSAAPQLPKDAVSVALLVKAKKLVQELGGVKEARTALNALAQLMD